MHVERIYSFLSVLDKIFHIIYIKKNNWENVIFDMYIKIIFEFSNIGNFHHCIHLRRSGRESEEKSHEL